MHHLLGFRYSIPERTGQERRGWWGCALILHAFSKHAAALTLQVVILDALMQMKHPVVFRYVEGLKEGGREKDTPSNGIIPKVPHWLQPTRSICAKSQEGLEEDRPV